MKKYAVNWAGIRYGYSGDDPAWANLKPGTILFVQSNGPSNASGNTIKEIGREKYIENSAKPPPMPTQTELNFTSGLKVLFVGMRPANAAKHTKVISTDTRKDGEEQKQGKKRKTNKGQSVQTQQDGLIISHDTEATRVVVPFGKQNVNYYVLLTPESSGICKGLSCDGDEVFFFEEFRDDIAATSFGARKIATAKAIRTAANIQTKAAPKAIDTSTAQNTEEKLSYKKISALVKIYLITSEPVLLRDCKRLLESKATDNAERNSHLQTSLRCDETVEEEEEAEEVKANIDGARLNAAQLFRLLVNLIGELWSDVDERLEALEKMLETLRDGIDEIWNERIRKGLRKLRGGIDEGWDQIDTSGVQELEIELMKGWIKRIPPGSWKGMDLHVQHLNKMVYSVRLPYNQSRKLIVYILVSPCRTLLRQFPNLIPQHVPSVATCHLAGQIQHLAVRIAHEADNLERLHAVVLASQTLEAEQLKQRAINRDLEGSEVLFLRRSRARMRQRVSELSVQRASEDEVLLVLLLLACRFLRGAFVVRVGVGVETRCCCRLCLVDGAGEGDLEGKFGQVRHGCRWVCFSALYDHTVELCRVVAALGYANGPV
jgi:hypothetical protein